MSLLIMEFKIFSKLFFQALQKFKEFKRTEIIFSSSLLIFIFMCSFSNNIDVTCLFSFLYIPVNPHQW